MTIATIKMMIRFSPDWSHSHTHTHTKKRVHEKLQFNKKKIQFVIFTLNVNIFEIEKETTQNKKIDDIIAVKRNKSERKKCIYIFHNLLVCELLWRLICFVRMTRPI